MPCDAKSGLREQRPEYPQAVQREVSMSWPYWMLLVVSVLAFAATGLWGWAYAAGAVLAVGCLMRGAIAGVGIGIGWIAVCYFVTGGTLEFIPPKLARGAAPLVGALAMLAAVVFGLLYIFIGPRAWSAHKDLGEMRSRREKRPRE